MSREDVEVVRRWVPPGDTDLVPWVREFVARLGPDFQREAVLAYWAQDPALQHTPRSRMGCARGWFVGSGSRAEGVGLVDG